MAHDHEPVSTPDPLGIETERCDPCRHMEVWVNGLADGSLKGLARIYTGFHVRTCGKCRPALAALQRLTLRLHALDAEVDPAAHDALLSGRHAAVEAAMDQIDRR